MPGKTRTCDLLIRRLSLITLIIDPATVSFATFTYFPGLPRLLNTILNTTFHAGSGELILRPIFTLCKSNSTACHLSSQWPRRDQTRRSHQFMNSTSDRFLNESPFDSLLTTKSSNNHAAIGVLVQTSTARLSIGRQIRDRSCFAHVGCLSSNE